MIKIDRIEPLLKKILLTSVVVVTLIYFTFLLFQNKQINTLQKNQIERFQSAVGIILKEYPEKEAEIIGSIFTENKESQSLGEEILKKYGYDFDLEVLKDPTFTKYRSDYIRNNTFVLLVVLILNITIIFFITKYCLKYLNKISNALNEFIKGNYNYDEAFVDEGIVNIISSQLNQLGKNISINYSNLEKEKESAKELVTDISHQLKTPLASISMCNSILEDEDISKEEHEEFLKMSNENVSKLNTLVDSLVNISRLEVAMIKLKPELNNINNTILRAYNSAYVKAKSKNINMELVLDNSNYDIIHDSKWTEEAIFNILENAIKYTDFNGKIKLSTEESINYIKINIEDNGIGISSKEFNNIFKRFYRVHEHVNSGIEGAGVGLYLSRKIVEEQRGSVLVKSKVGKGSVFAILLPK